MDIQSVFAILDVKDGRQALLKRTQQVSLPDIEVVIRGTIICDWGYDDGESQEFQVDVTSVKEVIKRKVSAKKPKEFPAPWTLPKKRTQRWYHNNATIPSPLAETLYDNGVKIQMSFWSQKGKPLNWDRAAKLCNSAYFLRYRRRRNLPQIVSMREVNTGEEFFPPRPNNQRTMKEYRGS